MNRFGIFFFFVFISFIVKEFPPFTRSDMYSYFPDKVTLYYAVDAQDKIIPFKKYYHYSIFDVAHNASAIRAEDYPLSDSTLLTSLNQIIQKYRISGDTSPLITLRTYTIDSKNLADFSLFIKNNGH